MAIRSEVLRAMLAAGATAEMLVAAVAAEEKAEADEVDAKTEKRRAQTAARVRRHRETHRNASNAGNGGNALPPPPSPDGPPPSPAPQPPPLNPSPHPGSEPDGSAGDAGQAGGEAAEEARSNRQALLTIGVDLISANTGRSRRSARALIGHWLGIARDEAAVVLDVIEDADGRELADFSTWVESRLRRRRTDLDRPPPSGPRGGSGPAPTGLAGRVVRLYERSLEGPYDVEPPAVDANSSDAEPSRGEDLGLAWQAGSGGRPANPLLRAAGYGGHDSGASRALRRRRAGEG
ncbi:hypothetical protein [Methylorubrum rhodesianum]|uniref:hypothetical protein n=1 Tax=Methylorubrum rhodesianum TaxID=29427 RepID=UPI00374672F7